MAIEALEDRVLLSINATPTGDDFPVSTIDTKEQVYGDVAIAPNGDFVVVWNHSHSSTDTDIAFRRFNADGTPKDSGQQSITTSSLNEAGPAVAIHADGSFVVVWTEWLTNDSNVVFKRFNANGEGIGSREIVSETIYQHYEADVAMFQDGGFVVTFTRRYSDGSELARFRLYDAQGTPLSNDRNAAHFESDNSDWTAVAASGSSFVVVWRESDFLYQDVYYRLFQKDGSDLAPAQRANTNEWGTIQRDPAVAMNATGDFVITWTHEYSSTDDNVRFRRFNRGGIAKDSSDRSVASSGSYMEDESNVSIDADGNFVVVYERVLEGDIYGADVYHKRYNASGSVAQAAENIASPISSTRNEGNPDVAMNAQGDFVAVFDEYYPATDNIRARLYRVDHIIPVGLFGPSAALNTNAGSDSGNDFHPQVTTDAAGNWVAVWRSGENLGGTIGTDSDILFSRSTDAGATWTFPVPLNRNASSDSGEDYIPQVTTDGAGNWVAVWASYDSLGGTIGTEGDILVARSTDAGATWTTPAPLNANAGSDSGYDWGPQVTTDAAGNWVAV